MAQTKFLDLDAVVSDVVFCIGLNDKKHDLVEPTVEVFIANMKEIEALSLTASPREELEATIRMILRSFPTMQEQELRNLRLTQLKKIQEFARAAGGEEVEKVTEDAEGNAPAAS